MNVTIADGRTHFWQWDINQTLALEGVPDGTEVHFSKPGGAYVVITAGGTAAVPNILLQDFGNLALYIYETDRTVFPASFGISPRPKPDDYVYEETKVYTWESMTAEMQAAVDAAKASEDAANTSAADALASKASAAQALSDLLAMLGTDVATLLNGKLPLSQIPATATQEIYQVSSSDELTGLVAQKGDLAELVETVNGEATVTKTWQLLGDDATIAANWVVWGTSYAVQAGNATTAQNAANADAVNGHRLVHFDTIAELEAATKISGTLYYAPYNEE